MQRLNARKPRAPNRKPEANIRERDQLGAQYAALAKNASRNKPALDQIWNRLKELDGAIEIAEASARAEPQPEAEYTPRELSPLEAAILQTQQAAARRQRGR